MKKVLVAVDSISGNTLDTAKIIYKQLEKEEDMDVTLIRINVLGLIEPIDYDIVYIGCWTNDFGSVPEDTADFLEDYAEALGKSAKNIFVFGTGETQWGIENFCKATDKVNTWASKSLGKPTMEPLKIEQYPANSKQLKELEEWVKETIKLGGTK